MHRRIMGVETEYGILHTPADPTSARMGPDEVARTLFRPVVEQHASSNIFALNGARLYLDVGSHPEYATPECDSVAQLLRSRRRRALQRPLAGGGTAAARRQPRRPGAAVSKQR